MASIDASVSCGTALRGGERLLARRRAASVRWTKRRSPPPPRGERHVKNTSSGRRAGLHTGRCVRPRSGPADSAGKPRSGQPATGEDAPAVAGTTAMTPRSCRRRRIPPQSARTPRRAPPSGCGRRAKVWAASKASRSRDAAIRAAALGAPSWLASCAASQRARFRHTKLTGSPASPSERASDVACRKSVSIPRAPTTLWRCRTPPSPRSPARLHATANGRACPPRRSRPW